MRYTEPRGSLSHGLLRYIRDEQPTAEGLLDWLGPSQASRFHVLRKAGLLVVQDGKVVLSPEHLTPCGKYFLYDNLRYHMDADRTDVFVLGAAPPDEPEEHGGAEAPVADSGAPTP